VLVRSVNLMRSLLPHVLISYKWCRRANRQAGSWSVSHFPREKSRRSRSLRVCSAYHQCIPIILATCVDVKLATIAARLSDLGSGQTTILCGFSFSSDKEKAMAILSSASAPMGFASASAMVSGSALKGRIGACSFDDEKKKAVKSAADAHSIAAMVCAHVFLVAA
jgi:hypothetical protein